MTLRNHVQRTRIEPPAIAEMVAAIHDITLRESNTLDAADFTTIHADDLARLFREYDDRFLGGRCGRHLVAAGTPLSFRISRRMTRAGGRTTTFVPRGKRAGMPRSYEIALSSQLLSQTFCGEDRDILVCGIECHNRLQAAQRIFEHELVHLIELAVWEDSSCSGSRFRDIAGRLFGHTAFKHALVDPEEFARNRFGIGTGSRVSFTLKGRHMEGVVNRVTKRATVLVEDKNGDRRLCGAAAGQANGKRYAKYLVPLSELRPVPS